MHNPLLLLYSQNACPIATNKSYKLSHNSHYWSAMNRCALCRPGLSKYGRVASLDACHSVASLILANLSTKMSCFRILICIIEARRLIAYRAPLHFGQYIVKRPREEILRAVEQPLPSFSMTRNKCKITCTVADPRHKGRRMDYR